MVCWRLISGGGCDCDTLGVCIIKIAFVCYASCVNCLKKDLFVNIKVICVIMILCKVLFAVNLNRVWNYCFCGGCFCKMQCNHCLAEKLSFQPKFKVNLPWKRQKSFEFKIPTMFSKIALYTLVKLIFAQYQSCRSWKVEQLYCWALFHLSFSLKVIIALQSSP